MTSIKGFFLFCVVSIQWSTVPDSIKPAMPLM
jgi:hypothetical protein